MALSEELKQFLENAKKEMMQLYEKIKRHPLTCLICIIVIIIAVLILIALPYWRVTQFGITNPKDLADAENSYRATLAQILGGIAVGIGIYFAWGNLTTVREGQITERFTRSVDQLGNSAIEIRLGGIYALERIAHESEKDYWPIMEILTAYVREKSPIKKENVKFEEVDVPKRVSLDIQAILTVLGRRTNSFNNGESNYLDLRGAYLREADLKRVHLEGANLKGAYLQKTYLEGAHLEKAALSEAHLEEASLKQAHLEEADLSEAHLEEASLKQVHLEKANLWKANLKLAFFVEAYLKETNFSEANLERATFSEAILEKANLWKANLEVAHFKGANLKDANLFGANLKDANFEGSNLEGTNLTEAYLKEAKNLTVDQLSKVKTLYNAELKTELKVPLRENYPHLFDEPKDEP